MVKYLTIEDFYEKKDKIIGNLDKQNTKIILVKIGNYNSYLVRDYNTHNKINNMVNEIVKLLEKYGIKPIYYNVEDDELSNCINKNKIDILLLLLTSLFVVLLLPIDAILRFIFKKEDIANKFAKIICSPSEKIIQRKILNNLEVLKKYIKNFENSGSDVIVIII